MAAVVRRCKSAIAPPTWAIARIVKMSVLWNDNGLAGVIVFEVTPLTCPWLPVPSFIQKGILRDRDRNTSVTFDLIAAITQPCRPIASVCQVSIWRQINLQANIINLHVATKAAPPLSRWVKIATVGHGYLKTCRVIDLVKAVQTLPALAIIPVGGIGALRNDQDKAGVALTPVPTIALPSVAIDLGPRICGYHGRLRLGIVRRSDHEKKREEGERKGWIER